MNRNMTKRPCRSVTHHWYDGPASVKLLAVLIASLVLVSCSGAKQAFQEGEEAEKRGDYYSAARSYIAALEEKPDYEEAIQALQEIAESAYKQKLKLAEGFQEKGQLDRAIKEYKDIRWLIDNTSKHITLTWVPINVDEAIAKVSMSAAKEVYERAEQLLDKGRYLRAIENYRSALDYDDSYKDANQKITEAYYRRATEQARDGQYRNAATTYLRADRRSSGYEDAEQCAAELYYKMGDYLLSRGSCRQAYKDLTKSKNLGANYDSLGAKVERANECATIRIAFVQFENTTGHNPAGMNVGSIISEAVRSDLNSKASQFLKVLTREQLYVLAEEQEMAEGAFSNAESIPSGFEGADYIVFGTLNQVTVQNQEVQSSRKTAPYDVYTEETYVNDEGERDTRTVVNEERAVLTDNRDARSVRIGGAIRVVSTQTREVALSHQISQSRSDEVRYATNIQAAHNLNADHVEPSEILMQLANARRELRDASTMIQDIINSVATSTSDQILREIDSGQSSSDPPSLSLSFLNEAD